MDMNTSQSPPLEKLLDWLEGRLPPEQAQAVAERLASAGAATGSDLAWLRAFLQASASAKLAAPPARVRDVLRQRFASRALSAYEAHGFFPRWMAALIFDSHLRPAAPGLRSATTQGRERQLLYATDIAEVVLNLQPGRAGQGWTVSGQLFPSGPAPEPPHSVQFVREGRSIALTATDDLGEFTVTNLPSGTYEVVISAADYELVLPPVLLEA